MRRHHEHGRGFTLQVRLAPNLTLQVNAEVKLFQALAFSNDDPFAHFLRAASSAALAAVIFSLRFAVSHTSSILALGIPARPHPFSLAQRSIARNHLPDL